MRWVVSLLCAGLLFALLVAFGIAAQLVMPSLLELLRTAPHLAMLGMLGFVLSPAAVITVAHRLGSRSLDRVEGTTPVAKTGTSSLAVGAHGWLVLYGSSVLTTFVLLVLNPPELEPEAFSIMGMVSQLVVVQFFSLHGAIWVGIATLFFELQRRGRA